MYKQVIIIRNDLKMRKGKMIAQGAHVSHMALGFTFPISWKLFQNWRVKLQWLQGGHKKIAVYVTSEEALLDVYNKAVLAGLPVAIVVDHGTTEFHGLRTRTAVCIGPALTTRIDLITEGFPLL